MKKFTVAMVVIILIGAVLTGVGCAVFFSSDFNSENVEYTEKFFETEEEISSLSLNLKNAHKIVFERGEKCSVKYFDSTVSSCSISVQNGKLGISESGWNGMNWLQRLFYKLQTTEIVVTVPDETVLDIEGNLNGAIDANLPSWKYGNINLDVNGACNIIANGISAQSIVLEVSGAANLVLSGITDSLKADTSGSVKIRGEGLECPVVDIRTSGSSEVNLYGTGRELTLHASGSGRLWAKNFTLERADIDASGSVEAELTVSTLLRVNSSGSSNISYWGDPQIDKSTSGSSKIVKKD